MKKKANYIIILLVLLLSIPCLAIPLDNGIVKLDMTSSGNFNIWGYTSKGDLIQTTYRNLGYTTFLKIGNEVIDVSFVDDTTVVHKGIQVEFAPQFIGDNYFKLQYLVTNTLNTDKVISIGFDADIQIDTNDKAPVEKIPGDKGFIMSNDVNRFTLICKNMPHIEPVDTYWFGRYNERQFYRYTQVTADSLTGVDSGMALSWQDRTIQPGETKSFSVLVGVGDVASVDILPQYTNIGDNTNLPLTVIVITEKANSLRIVDLKTNTTYYNGPIKDHIDLPLNREGDYQLQAQLFNLDSTVAKSSIININKVNILNRAINTLNLQNGLQKFLIINEKDRFFEDNSTNRAIVNKIKASSSGTYLIFNDISPVLQPLLEY